MATPGTEACDAVGGASRPKWREWPETDFWVRLVPTTSSQMPPRPPFALLSV